MLRFLFGLLFRDGPPAKGTRWALYVHHLGDYMHQWILLTPFGTLRLHHILCSDTDRHLHDHPFDFTSLLLSGGYWEVQDRGWCTVKGYHPRWSLLRRRAEQAHRLVLERPVWTLVVSGPKRRAWGFHTERGWVHHREYLKLYPDDVRERLFSEERREVPGLWRCPKCGFTWGFAVINGHTGDIGLRRLAEPPKCANDGTVMETVKELLQ